MDPAMYGMGRLPIREKHPFFENVGKSLRILLHWPNLSAIVKIFNMRLTVRKLEKSFNEICKKASPYGWDENHISYTLMERLRDIFEKRRIRFNRWSKIVDWQSFKNKGQQETKFGDIAIIVTIQFSSGEKLRGVACLEAKRDFPSGNFESIDLTQLTRIHGNLPYSQLLLYTQAANNLPLKFPDAKTWLSHFWVSPLNTAVAKLPQLASSANRNVLRVSFPFSNFLMARIFWGHDLDYRGDVVQEIAQGINRYFEPVFLGVVNVYYDNQRPIPFDLAEIWEPI